MGGVGGSVGRWVGGCVCVGLGVGGRCGCVWGVGGCVGVCVVVEGGGGGREGGGREGGGGEVRGRVGVVQTVQ